jgi:DNA polymerase-3 subunit delta
MAILHNHYVRMLRLDGAGVSDDRRAAEVLGLKSPFQARKALDGHRRLGQRGVTRAVALLAQADLDLRGAKDWPGEMVMEVLVARLARLAPAGRR